jgi:predicted esterase YcpF (UPF0227 family)
VTRCSTTARRFQKYAGARQLIVPGSDHAFAEFAQYLDSVLEFAGVV